MVIPRDLYYILNRQGFTNAPLCRAYSNDNKSITANQFEVRYSFLSPNDIETLEGDGGTVTVTATVGQIGKNDDGDYCAYLNVMDVQEIDRLDSVAYVDQNGAVRADHSDLYDPALVTPCIMSEVQVDPWPDVKVGDRVIVEIGKTIGDDGDTWFIATTFKGREETYGEVLRRFVEEGSFELASANMDWFRPSPLAPQNPEESKIVFGPPGFGMSNTWSIEFQPYVYHTDDGQPLPIEEARKLKRQGEDLELMHIPIGEEFIPFGENFHTLTDCDFKSVVGRVKRPVHLTWEDRDRVGIEVPSEGGPVAASAVAPQKIELLQRCMVGVRILDAGNRSREEAKQAFSRLLIDRNFTVSESDQEFFWVDRDPAICAKAFAPGSITRTTTTFMQAPDYSNDGDNSGSALVELRVVAAHEGDRKPIPTAKAKAIEDSKLMQVPLGYIHWRREEKRPPYQNPIRWTWTEGWEEPSEWAWADGWEEPIELTWKNVSGPAQRIIFMRHYLKMVYIEDAGELNEQEVVDAIEELVDIELRHGTDSQGRDYWWKVQRDGSTNRPRSRPSRYSHPETVTLLDLYGDKQRAHDAYWNIN